MLIGALVMTVALMMDTTVTIGGQSARLVATDYGVEELPEIPTKKIHNIGLIKAQQNRLILGGFLAIAGLLIALLWGDQIDAAHINHFQGSADELVAYGIEQAGDAWVYKGEAFSSIEAAVRSAKHRANS